MGDSKGMDPERGRCWGPRRWCIGMRPACGYPRVAVRNVRNLFVAPVREHSRKPDAGAAGAHRRGGARTRLIDPRKRG
jgi:hypothetical protein